MVLLPWISRSRPSLFLSSATVSAVSPDSLWLPFQVSGSFETKEPSEAELKRREKWAREEAGASRSMR